MKTETVMWPSGTKIEMHTVSRAAAARLCRIYHRDCGIKLNKEVVAENFLLAKACFRTPLYILFNRSSAEKFRKPETFLEAAGLFTMFTRDRTITRRSEEWVLAVKAMLKNTGLTLEVLINGQ